MSVRDDQLTLEHATGQYRLHATTPADNIIRVMRLFDTGLLTPKQARGLVLDVAQQAIDEAESYRNNLATLTDTWRTMDGWQDTDTVTTTGVYQPVAD